MDPNVTPGANWSVPIELVGRSDSAGATAIFTRALAAQCASITGNQYLNGSTTLPAPLQGPSYTGAPITPVAGKFTLVKGAAGAERATHSFQHRWLMDPGSRARRMPTLPRTRPLGVWREPPNVGGPIKAKWDGQGRSGPAAKMREPAPRRKTAPACAGAVPLTRGRYRPASRPWPCGTGNRPHAPAQSFPVGLRD